MSLESHDKSLKFLLAQDPQGFLRFGLDADRLQVLRPVETDVPIRARTTDGGYLIERDGQREVIHVEFFRMHQGLSDLALDIGEAQVRLFRRERVPVYSLLWDLYGSRKAKVLQKRALYLGKKGDSGCTRLVYRRVNLRGMSAAELLDRGPLVLYPLVPLTGDGAEIGAVRQAITAIEARAELTPSVRADHLAVLRFLAEAEDVPVKVLEYYLTKEKLMESSLYRSILEEGEARGRVEGEANSLIRLLINRIGHVAPEVRQIILAQAKDNPATLSIWFDEAAQAMDAEAAQRLVRKITAT